MGRRKKLVNNTNIPQHTIEAIARCIFPDILAYYESEEGQREFAQWKAEQEMLKTSKDNSCGNQRAIQSLLSHFSYIQVNFFFLEPLFGARTLDNAISEVRILKLLEINK